VPTPNVLFVLDTETSACERERIVTISTALIARPRWTTGFVRTCAATVIYAAMHSVFASRTVKRTAARLFGRRNRNALYRPFYLVQSVITIAVLMAYVRHQPARVLYHYKGLAAVPFRIIQAAGICWATAAAYQVGLLEILGVRPALRLLSCAGEIDPEPAAQGPALAGHHLRVQGPFRLTRHPLNVAPLPIVWFFPRMSTNLLAFNLVSTAYLVVGSVLEENRLLARYGDVYRDYQSSGVPFYVPRWFGSSHSRPR
jgi:methanethiol S-methyltransferase